MLSAQAPLQVYARMLAAKAQQQRALQRTDAVQADREDDASSDDEEPEAGSASRLEPSADRGEVLAASALPLAKKKARRPPAAPKVPVPKVQSLANTRLSPGVHWTSHAMPYSEVQMPLTGKTGPARH